METVARGVDERVRGETIEDVWFSAKTEPFKTPPDEMAVGLLGRRIERVRRVGKHIVCDLSEAEETGERGESGQMPAQCISGQWIVHLGMTGRLLVADASVPAPPHTHAVLRLSSGRELRFVDPRRFGRLALLPLHALTTVGSLAEAGKTPEMEPAGEPEGPLAGFRGPGVEPLAVTPEAFRALFHGRRTSIKAALLNQGILHGVGNIYADESLFRAGIRPRRLASRLSRAELGRLHAALQTVLREAIALGGSSVSDYVDAAGARGFFQLEHRVYMRTRKPCLTCGTPIRRIIVAGRGTHYCPVCQR